ncbi:MAG: trypsin-like serine protease [Sphingobacteriia bacterium]|nr:trypsin-like serine protease [Sphingobacteriia bacterium]NCC37933.1 trypsin-like serine protease [Gammaproteobacteria bacterium]
MRRGALATALILLSGCAAPPTTGRDPAPPPAGASTVTTGYPSLAPLLRQITPAVVDVTVKSRVAVTPHPLLSDPELRRFLDRFGLPLPEEDLTEQQRQSVGAGIIIDAARGHVLTNDHLLQGATEILVTLKDRRRFNARRLGGDPRADIAVLLIPPVAVRPLVLGDSDRLEVGDFVVAIGNPFGLGQTVTSGIVSAVERSGIADDRLGELIQTDASINPGNSGGPLIDLGGRVVGINTALIGPVGGNVGIGFAIPSNRAAAALERVLRTAGAAR